MGDDRVDDGGPVLRVVAGIPTAEELAALVGALRARGGGRPRAATPAGPSPWVRSGRPGGRVPR